MKREKYLRKLIRKFKNAGNESSANPFQKITPMADLPAEKAFSGMLNPRSRKSDEGSITRPSLYYPR